MSSSRGPREIARGPRHGRVLGSSCKSGVGYPRKTPHWSISGWNYIFFLHRKTFLPKPTHELRQSATNPKSRFLTLLSFTSLRRCPFFLFFCALLLIEDRRSSIGLRPSEKCGSSSFVTGRRSTMLLASSKLLTTEGPGG